MRIAHVPARRAALHGIRLSHPAIMQAPVAPEHSVRPSPYMHPAPSTRTFVED